MFRIYPSCEFFSRSALVFWISSESASSASACATLTIADDSHVLGWFHRSNCQSSSRCHAGLTAPHQGSVRGLLDERPGGGQIRLDFDCERRQLALLLYQDTENMGMKDADFPESSPILNHLVQYEESLFW
jgi:hypothetical protein